MSEVVFSSVRAKVDRAKSLIRDLNREILTYERSRPYRPVIDKESEPGKWRLLIKQSSPGPPVIIPILLGDSIHNLRSALDHLIVGLVQAVSSKNRRKIAFPMAADASRLQRGIKDTGVDALGPDITNYITSLQPYEGGAYGLWELHQLDITDKHHLIIPVLHPARIDALRVRVGQARLSVNNSVFRTKDGFVLITAAAGSDIEFNKKAKLGVEVTFAEESPFGGHAIMDTLFKMAQIVEEVVTTIERHYENFLSQNSDQQTNQASPSESQDQE